MEVEVGTSGHAFPFATQVNEAEKERINSELEHERRAKIYKEAELDMKKISRKLRSSIAKSRPYFEMKQETQQQLEVNLLSVFSIQIKAGHITMAGSGVDPVKFSLLIWLVQFILYPIPKRARFVWFAEQKHRRRALCRKYYVFSLCYHALSFYRSVATGEHPGQSP